MKKAVTKNAADNPVTAASKDNADGLPCASQLIDARISELKDWRGTMLAQVRALIRQADPEVVEEWKWRGVPVWSHNGILCTGETYQKVVKLTFAKGAALADPSGLFNASLEGTPSICMKVPASTRQHYRHLSVPQQTSTAASTDTATATTTAARSRSPMSLPQCQKSARLNRPR